MKKVVALTLLMALVMSAVAGLQSVMLVNANFDPNTVVTPPPAGVEPPTISIVSPENKVYTSREIVLIFNAGSAKYTNPLGASMDTGNVHYMQNETFIDYGTGWYSINLTSVPDGVHTVSVRVRQGCFYGLDSGVYYFNTENQAMVRFTVDSTAPLVTILTKNTFYLKDVPLSFTADDFVSLFYVIDSKENVTISGNVTLTGLSYGLHNVTICARDEAGNIGASENFTFAVAKEQPKLPPIAYSMGIVAGIVLVLLGAIVYVLKRKRQDETK